MHFASGSWTAQPLKPSSTLTRHLVKWQSFHQLATKRSNTQAYPRMATTYWNDIRIVSQRTTCPTLSPIMGSYTNSHSLAKHPAQQISTKGVPGESIFNKASTSTCEGTTWRKMLWDTMFHWTKIVGRVWTRNNPKDYPTQVDPIHIGCDYC